ALDVAFREVGIPWLALANLSLLLPVLATVAGGEMGKLHPGSEREGLSSFLGTRPVTDADLVRAKLLMTALSTLAAWGVVLVGSAAWLGVTGRLGELVREPPPFLHRLGGAR